MVTINVSTKTVYYWGVRHPDESSTLTMAYSVTSKSLTMCGAKDTGVAGQRCKVESYRDGAANQYINRIVGGIKRDTCQWRSSPYSRVTAGASTWEEIEVFGGTPPSGAIAAIVQVLNPSGTLIGFKHPDEVSNFYLQTVSAGGFFIAPLRQDSASSYIMEVFSSAAITVYIRGWILPTNPGIFTKVDMQAIDIGTTASTTRSVAVSGYNVTGGFFLSRSGSGPQVSRCKNPNWTVYEEYDVANMAIEPCSCDSNEYIENRCETTNFAQGFNVFTGSLIGDWPHDLGGVSNPDIGKAGGVSKSKIGKIGGVS